MDGGSFRRDRRNSRASGATLTGPTAPDSNLAKTAQVHLGSLTTAP